MGIWTPGPGATGSNDTYEGDATNETVDGLGGNDTLRGRGGADTLNGGANDDTLNMTASAVNEVANVNWNGSEITGLLNNALISIETVNLDMGLGDDWLVYSSTAGVEVNLSIGLATGFNQATAIENVIGGSGNDVITGSEFGNKLNGAAGDDTIRGGQGNDNLTGGLGNDTFVYAAGDGADTINDFDAWAVGGQDLIDITGFGITAGDFAARVAVIDVGADTVVRIDNDVFITLKNVTGDGDNSISIADFLLA
jgi:serralysin